MQVKLEDIARIRTGYTFREALEDVAGGDIRVLQIKDIRQKAVVDAADLPRVLWAGRGEPPVLQPDEVVLAARGEHNRAAIYVGGEPVVATNQLLILSVVSHHILPEFLCWALNQDSTQRLMKTEGSNITAINKAGLAAIELSVPPVETQKKILALQGLWDQEQVVMARLQRNREAMVNGMFRKLLGNEYE